MRILLFFVSLCLASQPWIPKHWVVVGVGNTAARPATCTASKHAYINTQTSVVDYCVAGVWTAMGTGSGAVTTGVTLTADLPVIGAGGSAVAVGTRSGNTTKYGTVSGSLTSGNCIKSDANGNLVDHGGTCGGSGGGLVLVQSQTASASASLDFASCFSSTYDEYKITVSNIVTSGDAVAIYVRVSTDGGSSYISTGSYTYRLLYWNTTSAISSATTGTGILFGEGWSTSAKMHWNGEINVYAPLAATGYKGWTSTGSFGQTGITGSAYSGAGWYNAETAITDFQIIPASGTLTSGTVRCYGLAK